MKKHKISFLISFPLSMFSFFLCLVIISCLLQANLLCKINIGFNVLSTIWFYKLYCVYVNTSVSKYERTYCGIYICIHENRILACECACMRISIKSECLIHEHKQLSRIRTSCALSIHYSIFIYQIHTTDSNFSLSFAVIYT